MAADAGDAAMDKLAGQCDAEAPLRVATLVAHGPRHCAHCDPRPRSCRGGRRSFAGLSSGRFGKIEACVASLSEAEVRKGGRLLSIPDSGVCL